MGTKSRGINPEHGVLQACMCVRVCVCVCVYVSICSKIKAVREAMVQYKHIDKPQGAKRTIKWLMKQVDREER